jgi:hypothetical protein
MNQRNSSDRGSRQDEGQNSNRVSGVDAVLDLFFRKPDFRSQYPLLEFVEKERVRRLGDVAAASSNHGSLTAWEP